MKIAILGDLCLSYPNEILDDIKKIMEDYNKSSILEILNKNDFNIVNLEAPISNSNNAINKIGPNLKNPIQTIDFLKRSNIGICSLANNHIYDFGFEGLKDTLKICKKNEIKTFGAGLEPNTIKKPIVIEKNNIKVAFISFAENEFNSIDFENNGYGSNNLDIIELYNQIKYAKSVTDHVIIIAHGGHEQYQYPSPRIKKLYHFLIDIGADAVIAHHPHVIQGIEQYKDKSIFYSIGNYFFPSIKKNISNHEGFIVVLEIEKTKLNYEIVPYTQCLNEFSINVIEGKDKSNFLIKLDNLSNTISDDKKLEDNWNNFASSRHDFYYSTLFPLHKKITYRLLKFGIEKLFLPKKHILKVLNLIRCESHRDIYIKTIKDKIVN